MQVRIYFTKWVETMLPEEMRVKVTSEIGTENKVESQRGDEPIVFTLDGKTVRSTERLESFEDPLLESGENNHSRVRRK